MQFGDRLHGGIGIWVGCSDRAECIVNWFVGECFGLDQTHPRLGQSAGLVGADHTDSGQALDCREFVDQTVVSTKPHYADREGHAGQQDQALGHHGHECADHAQESRAPVSVLGAEGLVYDRQDSGWDQQEGDDLQDRVDAIAQMGVDQGEAPGLLGEFGGVGVIANPDGSIGAGASDHEAPRPHLIAGLLVDRIRLASQQGFVDLELTGVDDFAVNHDLVADAAQNDVVEDEFFSPDLDDLSIAPYLGASRTDYREAVECVLGSDLLDDADDGVEDDQQAKSAVGPRTGCDHKGQQHGQDCVDSGEDIGLDDVEIGATDSGGGGVDFAALHTSSDLSLVEP